MGMSYSQICVLGVRIDPSAFEKKTTTVTKNFDHSYPPEMKYCPETGKSLWYTYTYTEYEIAGTSYSGVWDDGENGEFAPFRGVAKYRVFHAGEGSGDWYLGLQMANRDWYPGLQMANRDNYSEVEYLPPIDQEEVKEFIRKTLEPYGLSFSDADFGFWFITQVI